jgi:hypothetical protein
MNLKRTIVSSLFIVMLFLLPCVAWTCVYQEKRISMPIEKEIENSIPMKELENKFVVVQCVAFGGAGAGGLGAPQMFAFSAEQFLKNAENEKIYSAATLSGFDQQDKRATVYKKIYWAFIENRAGIIIYEKTYSQPGFIIEGVDSNNVYFFGTNGWLALGVAVVVFVVTLVATLYIDCRLADCKWYKKT